MKIGKQIWENKKTTIAVMKQLRKTKSRHIFVQKHVGHKSIMSIYICAMSLVSTECKCFQTESLSVAYILPYISFINKMKAFKKT